MTNNGEVTKPCGAKFSTIERKGIKVRKRYHKCIARVGKSGTHSGRHLCQCGATG